MAQCKDHMISIKMTGLIDMLMLKKWNDAVTIRNNIWKDFNENDILSYEGLAKGLRVYANVSEEDVSTYIKMIHNFEGDVKDFKISEFHFKINHHPYYIYEKDKNETKVIRSLFNLS